MKTKYYLIALLALSFLTTGSVLGQTSYLITSNKSWSAVLPNTCANCSIVISSGVTLTIDQSVTCQNCTFEGGNLSMTDKTLNIQYAGSVVTTLFKNIAFQIYGNDGKVIVNAPLSLDGATFTFNNGSYFNTSYQVDLVNSKVNLLDNATMYSTGGASTLMRLSSGSKIVIGDGSLASTAAFTVSGPSLSLYGASTVVVGNTNNAYYNWSSYSASPANSVNAATPKAYSTSSSTMNCGGPGQHACSSPALYGPATLANGGTLPGNTLPVTLTGFTARSNGDGTAQLTWETAMEQNASRFEIERSADGSSWSKIGSVNAKGNSASVSGYGFTDMSLLSGTSYYRLKMVDLDGSAVYSEVKAIQGTAVSHISFFPNPAKDYVNVTLGGTSTATVNVRLVSQTGAVLQEKSVAGGAGTIVTFPLQQVASGLYVLYVSAADGTHESSKLLINRQ
ncbi:T9SS type A sorting domain-containing protein [Flavitalea sp. BT771]|uniref:T9SS type A sorting domain-containing protein n=1 Tax=Flavitalea sp. BT771 TaxID=3063329 RepID=UPI0026E3C2AA|nr:T9SS type A sorting domain-containing protein [Flavitalea sp. BT771]MDO6433336.1 T9SS type A sorting domain-containing protein [Flavitalea sp. BT771]MDV6222759.1 T9SS type A sorting domain-containing protein [Flavitalea sp. BT771]